jgi:peptidoglycan/xylan/chitin deacetylase (PgdA/CDA1 family)
MSPYCLCISQIRQRAVAGRLCFGSAEVGSMKRVSILMYHQVGKFSRPRAHRATFCHIRRFKAQMAYLDRFGYTVMGLQDALDGLFGNGPVPRKAVVLTFDDGCQNFRDYAFPVLQQHGFPATVFLVSGLLGKNAQWLADRGRAAPRLMDRAAIRQLRGENITFGSHSLSHPSLTRISPLQQTEEIVRSKADLEDLLGEGIRYFCYPNGDFDDDVAAMVRKAGYTAALTCIRGSATPSDNVFALPRKAISYGDSLVGYFWKLHMKHKKKVQPETNP